MNNKFNIKDYLTSHREEVIAKYNALSEERFFDGVSLKNFMVEVMNMMAMNAKSEKRADMMLPMVMGNVYSRHTSFDSSNSIDERRKANMPNQQWAAIV